MTAPRRITVAKPEDERGILEWISAEDLPFVPVRMYWHREMKVARGLHAHKETHRLFVCVSGKAMLDVGLSPRPGETRLFYPLESGAAVYVTPMWYARLVSVTDAVVVVLADRPYDPEDYLYPEECLAGTCLCCEWRRT